MSLQLNIDSNNSVEKPPGSSLCTLNGSLVETSDTGNGSLVEASDTGNDSLEEASGTGKVSLVEASDTGNDSLAQASDTCNNWAEEVPGQGNHIHLKHLDDKSFIVLQKYFSVGVIEGTNLETLRNTVMKILLVLESIQSTVDTISMVLEALLSRLFPTIDEFVIRVMAEMFKRGCSSLLLPCTDLITQDGLKNLACVVLSRMVRIPLEFFSLTTKEFNLLSKSWRNMTQRNGSVSRHQRTSNDATMGVKVLKRYIRYIIEDLKDKGISCVRVIDLFCGNAEATSLFIKELLKAGILIHNYIASDLFVTQKQFYTNLAKNDIDSTIVAFSNKNAYDTVFEAPSVEVPTILLFMSGIPSEVVLFKNGKIDCKQSGGCCALASELFVSKSTNPLDAIAYGGEIGAGDCVEGMFDAIMKRGWFREIVLGWINPKGENRTFKQLFLCYVKNKQANGAK
jgi:hypothetical protein